MAALSLNGAALSLSSAKSGVRIPARSKSQHSNLSVARFRAPSRSNFIRLNGSYKPHVMALPSRRREFKSLCLTSASESGGGQLEPPSPEEDTLVTMSGDAPVEAPPPEEEDTVVLSAKPPPEEEDKAVMSAKPPPEEKDTAVISAIPIVMAFYEGINKKKANALTDLLAEKCVLKDAQFPQAFEGKKVVLKFIQDLIEAMGKGMKFAIEEISEGDDLSVVVIWHLEWEGRQLAFTRGCSFYFCEKQGEKLFIRYVQDFIEPPIKPGATILRLLKIISSLFEHFPVVAQNLLANSNNPFEGVIMIYKKYLNPIIRPFVNPFIIYYRGIINIFLYWANFLFNIVVRIIKLFSS